MMKLAAVAALVATGCLVAHGAAAIEARWVDGLTLGSLEVRLTPGEPQALVFLLSGDDGLTPEIDRAASRLAARGLIVAPVDVRRFLARQDALGRDCLYLVGDLEETSRRIQALAKRGSYLTPIVAGTGTGAAVAYAALAQAPAATLAGAASDGFSTRVNTRAPLCAGAPARPAAEGGFTYAPAPLPGWWRVAPAPDDTQAAADFAQAAGIEDALVPAPEGGLAERLAALLEAPLGAGADGQLSGLPLVELPAAVPGRLMAVVYSGDGGWRDLDRDIAARLQSRGIPVVGVDSLRYFWSEKSPETVATDLARIMARYREQWQRPDVMLIGYSFGADVLPFAFNRLSDQDRASVTLLALLGLSRSADFEIRVAGWLGINGLSGSQPTAPEMGKLPPGLVQCFYGEEETDTACTSPEMVGARLVRTSGGHHFDGDYDKLADAIIAAAKP